MPHQCTACGHTFDDGSKEMLGGCPDCGGNKFQFYPEGTEVPDEPPEDAAEAVPDSPEPDGAASTVGRAATKVRDFVSNSPSPEERVDDEPPSVDEPLTADEPPTDEPSTADGTAAASGGSAESDAPDPNAPWPDSSDAADPIRKGGFQEEDDDAPDSADEDGIIDADARAAREAVEDAEDRAQSDARAGVASDAEVASAGGTDADDADDADDASTADAATGTGLGDEGDLEAAEATVDREADAEGRVVSEPTGEEPDLSELREQLNDQFESIKILEPGQYELNLMELYDREEYIIALQENGRYVIQVPENWMGEEPGE
ncbi:OapC/ArvC family zinc-ribbon domain-containing protein [Halorarius halobius]|uniref:OapC/ArvC family zinc-ribbon domain-containing protein n=1 Tax=Halorarius halobius TaxID=2962671 RepID=UPI0020CF7186|nr:Zn-ribbon containing protein [Halorarius halobius]